MKGYLISYVIAVLVTLISVLIGLRQTGDVALQTVFTVCVPIVAFLIADKVTSFLSYRAEARRQTEVLQETVPSIQSLRVFPDSPCAFEYLKANLPLANRVHNTRMSPRASADPAVRNSQRVFDQLIKRSLRKGSHYSEVVSLQHEEHRRELLEFVEQKAPPGQLQSTELDTAHVPVLNFIVLEYEGGSEVIFGWVIASNYDHTNPVFLSRESRVIDFFLSYHRILRGA